MPHTFERKPRWSQRVFTAWEPFLYLTPALLVMVTMTVFPFIYTLTLSFHRWNLTFARPRTFIGLANYQSILHSADFWASAARTAWYVGSCVAIEFAAGVLIAFLLDTQFIGRSIVRALILLPMVMAPVVAGLIWRFIFNDEWGLANTVLNLFGISSKAWLVDPHLAFFAVVVADVWQWTPFIALIALAGLQAVPKELTEAARVDGATWLQIQRFVTVPIIRPILAIGLLIRLIDCFRNVDQIFVMTYGGPGVATSVLGFYTYLKGFKFFDMGYTAALGIVLVLIISVLAQSIVKIVASTSRHRI
ncbi:MAG: sugar ABC transporter permease [Verrucomicrobia bacterium]|nr:sugar ABC transporter permease [Verrucomicrobiota bacterium]